MATNFISTIFKLRSARIKYIRPHTFSFLLPLYVAGAPQCISFDPATGQALHQPVRLFLVQSDLANGGIINIGDGNTSLTNGIQLDPGRAMQFAVGNDEIIGSLFQTPMTWQEAVGKAKESAAGNNTDVNVFLDMADFFVAGDIAGPQRVRIFWSSLPA